jgi:fused signal recognition particle receptor
MLEADVRYQIELIEQNKHVDITELLTLNYLAAFYERSYTIAHGSEIAVRFNAVSKAAVEKAVRTKWSQYNYSQTIWNDRDRLVRAIQTIIPQSFSRGLSSNQLGDMIAKEMDASRNRGRTLARTEVNYISNQADLDAYKMADIEEYEYLATLDMRTSEVCRSLDGTVHKVSHAKVGVNFPPMHPNCRSTTIAKFDDQEVEERVARDKYVGTGELNLILRDEIAQLLTENNTQDTEGFVIPEGKKPYVVMVVGVNGVGKTTTIGKLAYQFKQAGLKVVLGAADTFRAAAVEQIVIWGERVGVPVIKQQMGSDPASVAFDTLQSAMSSGADVVLIDTAGRLHNKKGLMDELSKIKRVMQKLMPDAPHDVMLVLDGSTGQNAYEQAKQFTAATEVTSMAVTKLDGTAKGGVVIGISDQFKIPVRYIGLGEKMEDLQPFNRVEFVDSLFK